MVEKVVLLVGAITALLSGVATPITVAWMRRQEKEDGERPTQPTFGMTVQEALDRSDRRTSELIAELKIQRDEARDEVWELRLRLEAANAALAENDLPMH